MRLFYRVCQCVCLWTNVLLVKARCFGMRNVPATGGVLIVCNHQSFLDPPLVAIGLRREANYLARHGLFDHRPFRWLIEHLNAFPVRQNTADIRAIKESLRRLRAGQMLVVFPEGSRTEDGRIAPFLPGAGVIAKRARVPIVPTLIDGTFQAWPRHQLLPRTGNVILEFGPPIMPADYEPLTDQALLELLRDRLIAMQACWHSRAPARRLNDCRRRCAGNEPIPFGAAR